MAAYERDVTSGGDTPGAETVAATETTGDDEGAFDAGGPYAARDLADDGAAADSGMPDDGAEGPSGDAGRAARGGDGNGDGSGDGNGDGDGSSNTTDRISAPRRAPRPPGAARRPRVRRRVIMVADEVDQDGNTKRWESIQRTNIIDEARQASVRGPMTALLKRTRSVFARRRTEQELSPTARAASDTGPPGSVDSAQEGRGLSMADVVLTASGIASSGATLEGTLELRDLRAIDPSFVYVDMPSFIVRRHAIVCHADPFRAVIFAHKAFFLARETEAGRILPLMSARLKKLIDDDEEEHKLDEDAPETEGDEEAFERLRTPFEFLAVEAFLQVATEEMFRRLDKLSEEVAAGVAPLKARVATQEELLAISEVKERLRLFAERDVRGMERALVALLEDGEDLSLMYLYDQAVEGARWRLDASASAHTEVEQLLEVYLMDVATLLSRTRQVENSVAVAEAQHQAIVQISRVRLHKIEITVTFIGALVGVGGMWAGMMGMNVPNGWEDSPTAWDNTVWVTIVLLFALSAAICYFTFRSRLVE